ncbi:MAG TPA: hypothetical protein VIM41_10175 [Gammaproteobacteria bacterium]
MKSKTPDDNNTMNPLALTVIAMPAFAAMVAVVSLSNNLPLINPVVTEITPTPQAALR